MTTGGVVVSCSFHFVLPYIDFIYLVEAPTPARPGPFCWPYLHKIKRPTPELSLYCILHPEVTDESCQHKSHRQKLGPMHRQQPKCYIAVFCTCCIARQKPSTEWTAGECLPSACPARYLCIKYPISSPSFIPTLGSPPSRPQTFRAKHLARRLAAEI